MKRGDELICIESLVQDVHHPSIYTFICGEKYEVYSTTYQEGYILVKDDRGNYTKLSDSNTGHMSFYKYFMTIQQYREKQLKDILG